MQVDNPFDATFVALRERNRNLSAHLIAGGAREEFFWLTARYWFIAGASTFRQELVCEEALACPSALLEALNEVQDRLIEASRTMFADMAPHGRRH